MMMAREKSVTVSLLSAVAFTAYGLAYASTAALAQDAASFYRGKVISLVVGSSPGGGFDSYARLLAPHLEQETGTTVVVVNRPGAGGLLALNQVYNAKPDGLTIVLAGGTAALLGQLTEKEGVRYDLLKFSWLARVATHNRMWLVSGNSPHRSVENILKSNRPIKFAAAGKTDGLSDTAAVICKALEIECKIIIGYKNSKEAALAVMRGEADALASSDSSSSRYTKGGEMVAIATVGRQRSGLYTDVPTIFEQVELTADQAWWFDFHEKMRKVGRVLVAPPGVPEDRVAYLRHAFDRILSDPKVVAQGNKIRRYISYAPAGEVKGLAAELLDATPSDRLKEVRWVLLEAYY